MPLRAIGQIIRDRRLELGLTQEELAERISTDADPITQADLSRIETGRVRLPRAERLASIADALDLSLGDLLMYASGVDEDGRILVERQRHPDEPDMVDPSPLHREFSSQSEVLEYVQQAVMVTDPDGILRYWNAHSEQVYGWRAEEVLGRDAVDVIVADRAPWHAQVDTALSQLAAGQPWRGELLARRRDGSTFMAYISLAPVRDRDGILSAVFVTSHELSPNQGSAGA